MDASDPNHVINIGAMTCPPEADKIFNEWYDDDHVQVNMRFKGLLGITRYKLIHGYEAARVQKYPNYLTTYRLKDMDTFKVWNASPELEESIKNWHSVCASRGVRMNWRAQYRCIRVWQKTLPQSVIIFVGTQCPPETEAKFDDWYSNKHIPDLLHFKKLLGVTRYKYVSAIGPAVKNPANIPVTEYPGNLTFYHFDNFRAFDGTSAADAYDNSKERAATSPEFAQVKKDTGVSLLWRAQYEPLKSWLR